MNNKEIRREQILKAATEVFARYGLSKTTIEDIAKEAGVGKSSIYYYFENKDEIFKAVIEEQVRAVQEKIKNAIENVSDPVDKLKTFAITRMKCFREVAHVYEHVFKEEYLKHYEYIQNIRKSYDEAELQLLKQILAEGVEKGVFKIKDLDLVSFVIMVGIKGLEYEWATIPEAQKIEEDSEKLFEILLHGILK
ncbi:MAG: TetR/AcrR family transcriptional regulator [candidate division WOR-3 bacterium]